MTAMSRVADGMKKEIQELVNKPGVYAVEQLLIDFGTADLMALIGRVRLSLTSTKTCPR